MVRLTENSNSYHSPYGQSGNRHPSKHVVVSVVFPTPHDCLSQVLFRFFLPELHVPLQADHGCQLFHVAIAKH